MARKKKASSKKANATTEEQQTLQDLLQSKGFEGASASSYAMPFLRILQKLSPEVDKTENAFVKGADPGDIYHTISKDVFEEVNIIPLQYRDTYIEWIPRSKGGGFVQEYDALDQMTKEVLSGCTKEENKNMLPNGNEFKLHSNYYCAFETEDGEWEPVMISMSSSQLKTSRIWLSTMRRMVLEVNGESYRNVNIRSFQWTLGTEMLENDKGKWFGWTYAAGDNTLLLPQIGPIQEAVREAVTSNLLTFDRSQQQSGGDTSENAL